MKYIVIKRFTCKLSKKPFKDGDFYETDDLDRAEFLQNKGRLGEMILEEQPDPPTDDPATEENPNSVLVEEPTETKEPDEETTPPAADELPAIENTPTPEPDVDEKPKKKKKSSTTKTDGDQ